MAIVPKSFYRFNTIPVKSLAVLFEVNKLILKVCNRVLRGTEPIRCISLSIYLSPIICETDYIKKLAHAIVGAGKSELFSAGPQAGDPGKRQCFTWRLKAVWRQNFFFLRGITSFFLLRSSTCWMKPIHSMEDNLLHSKATDLNADHIEKYLPSNI